MKTHFRFQIILTVSLFFAIVFNANAQSSYSLDHQFKSGFNNDEFDKPAIDQPHLFDDRFPQKFLKNNFTEDLLDSVVYTNHGGKFKESFSYNPNKMKASHSIHRWDTDTGDWQNEKIHTYTYDDAGNIVYEFQEFWFIDIGLLQTTQAFSTYDNNGNRLTYYTELLDTSSGQWFGIGEGFTCTYDANNNQLTKLIQSWNSATSNWEDYRVYTFEYDSNNNLLMELYEAWSNNSSSWLEQWRNSFTYDNRGNQISAIYEVWSVNGDPLINSQRITNTYDDSDNLLISILDSWVQTLNQWISYGQYYYTYDLSDNELTRLIKLWDATNEKWVNNSLVSSSYNVYDKIVIQLIQIWNESSNSWLNNVRFNSTYDNIGNRTVYLTEWWNTQLNDWENLDRKLYGYENGNYLTHFHGEIWNSGWIPYLGEVDISNNGYFYSFTARELTAYYSPLTDIDDSENLLNSFSLSQNYPNPFNPSTTIEYEIPRNERSEMSKVKLVVYDLLGSVVRTLVDEQKSAGKHKVTFDASKLPSGVYFYQINAGSFNQVRKMLLLK